MTSFTACTREAAKIIATGEDLWKETARLQPQKYKPEFVWDRVHNGFKDMPAWKELYSSDQVIWLVAWVLSDEFWP